MKTYLKSKFDSLNDEQKSLYNQMKENSLLQICIPTGAGKGYLMIFDILSRVLSKDTNVIAISTHRLMLNGQHMDDIFDTLSPLIGNIGYIFVGSSKFNNAKFQNNKEFNTKLKEKNISYNEIVTSTPSSIEVNNLVQEHLKNGRKVIIVTTYHSLNKLKSVNIDSLYCDEAHTLASESISKFQRNFEEINFKNCYFFTATPKDCADDETSAFLMSNEEVFGKRVGLDSKTCIEKGYITSPMIQIAKPENYDSQQDYMSIQNLAKFVKDTFFFHRNWVKENSYMPELIDAIVLYKCSSVEEMWDLYKELLGKVPGVKICAGASKSGKGLDTFHYVDNIGIKSRTDYLKVLQGESEDIKYKHLNINEGEMAIVLHYDTMSEGINVPFTGTCFLGRKLPTKMKSIQTIGRGTRLHWFDRERLKKGEIIVGDGKWVKPNNAVIIPYWDREGESTSNELAKMIREFRNYGFNPAFKLSIGDDTGAGKEKDDEDNLNELDKNKIKSALIEKIEQEILEMDNKDDNDKLVDTIKSLSDDDWINFIYG